MKHVLVAVDDSVESLAAARYAASLAKKWNASVRLVTVIADQTHRTEAEHLLAHVTKDVLASGVSAPMIDSAIRTGTAYSEILDCAREWPAALIVMAVSHRAGLRSPYVGSQTEHVLEFATCPVLVVPNAPTTES